MHRWFVFCFPHHITHGITLNTFSWSEGAADPYWPQHKSFHGVMFAISLYIIILIMYFLASETQFLPSTEKLTNLAKELYVI